jgi:integrase
VSIFKRGKSDGKYTVLMRVNGTPKRFPGPRDRKAALALERRLKDLRDAGELDTYEKYGEARKSPLADHKAEYLKWLKGKGRSHAHVYIVDKRLQKVIDDSGWVKLGDVTLGAFERWQAVAAEEKTRWGKRKPQTLNQFAETWHTFLAWCVRRNALARNPLDKAEPIREIENERFRRTISKPQFVTLLKAATAERRLIYRFVATTALRKGTIRTLKWSDLRLDQNPPVVVVKGENIKGRRLHEIPLARKVVRALKRKQGEPNERVFPELQRKLWWFKKDLKKAGIEYETPEGRFDMHAFRKTFSQWAEDAGVTLEQISKILHHRDIRTTQKHYRGEGIRGSVDAIEKMNKRDRKPKDQQ